MSVMGSGISVSEQMWEAGLVGAPASVRPQLHPASGVLFSSLSAPYVCAGERGILSSHVPTVLATWGYLFSPWEERCLHLPWGLSVLRDPSGVEGPGGPWGSPRPRTLSGDLCGAASLRRELCISGLLPVWIPSKGRKLPGDYLEASTHLHTVAASVLTPVFLMFC